MLGVLATRSQRYCHFLSEVERETSWMAQSMEMLRIPLRRWGSIEYAKLETVAGSEK